MLLQDPCADLEHLDTLGQLFEDCREKLLAMIHWRSPAVLAGRRDPEDILQKAYLKAQQRRGSFKVSGMKPYPWLYRLVMDEMLDDYDYQTRRRRNPRAEVAWPDRSSQQLVLGLVGKLTSPSSVAARKEVLERLQQRVQQILDQLAPEFREVLCMHFVDELNLREIAEVLGITHGAARKCCTRARLRFQDLWKQLYGNEGLEP